MFKQLKQRALLESKEQAPSVVAAAREDDDAYSSDDAPPPRTACLDFNASLVHSASALKHVYLFRDFLTADEEACLLARLDGRPWTDIKHRRLQCYGGDPVRGAPRPGLPAFLSTLAVHLQTLGCVDFEINHALVNEYNAGQGILAHTDGPMYAPRVCCVSLAADAVMTFTLRTRTEDVGIKPASVLVELVLPARSLVVFGGDAFTDALHSIAPVGARRVSITLRRILV